MPAADRATCTFVPNTGRNRHGWSVPGLCLLLLTLLVSHNGIGQQPQRLLPVFHFKRLSTANGLSTNEIRSRIVRDEKGFVWIGTTNGLDRYDGYSVKDYRNRPDDPFSLSSNTVTALLIDTRHRLWIGTWDTGLSLYDPSRDRFLNFRPPRDGSALAQTRTILSLLQDNTNTIWVGTSMGGLVRVDLPTDHSDSAVLDTLVRRCRFRAYPLGTPRNTAYELCEREDGNIIVASDSGLIIVDPMNHSLSRPHLADPAGQHLDSIRIFSLSRSPEGELWIGTGTEGVFRVNWRSDTARNYRHRTSDTLSLRSDDIRDMVVDRNGYVWIATLESIDLFSAETGRRVPYLTSGERLGGSHRPLFSVDRTGTLWFGTTASGAYWLSPKTLRIPHYALGTAAGLPGSFEAIEPAHDRLCWFSSSGKAFQIDVRSRAVFRIIDFFQGKKPSYSTPDRTSTYFDDDGNLWYGTWGLGMYRVNLSSGRVKNFRYVSPLGKESTVRSIARGMGDSLWLASYTDGLKNFDPRSGTFQDYSRDSISYASDVMKDRRGRLWISTEADGLLVIDPATGMIQRLRHDPDNPRSLGHDRTRNSYQDPRGRIWVAAGNVINLYDSLAHSFEHFPNPAFPFAIYAKPIGSDAKGRLWVDYGNGISVLDPSTRTFRNFDASYGLCGRIVDMKNLEGGSVLLSGSQGINVFNPDSAGIDLPVPPLALTRISINDESAVPPTVDNGRGVLGLSYLQDVLEFEFACLDIDVPSLIAYRYQLEGLEKQWVKPKERRYVRYTAVPPGEYVFRVEAIPLRGEWPGQQIALSITISPPWWQTVWAYAAYVGVFLGVLFTGHRLRLRGVRLHHQMEMEHSRAERIEEVDRLKSRFFANISHEFRTPITLIQGPIEGLLERTSDPRSVQQLGMIRRNANVLLQLINQLLDLSKLEAGAMKLRACRMNIVPLIKGIVFSFESSAGIRGVALNVAASQDEIEAYVDKDMVEKIVSNLLSNAFKFTPKGGRVSLSLRAERSNLHTGKKIASSLKNAPRNDGFGEGCVVLSVSDTGIGIPPDQLDRVFDRFYQVDGSQIREQEGSGIGLALVKELVELHHGTISVRSSVGSQSDVPNGTEFTVRLPLGREHLKDGEVISEVRGAAERGAEAEIHSESLPPPAGKEPDAKQPRRRSGPVILIVEDNADVRLYIKDNLAGMYHILEAEDGAEGVQVAQETIPDLIISDVMMPKMDGYALCKSLKNDEKTSHIPIILLTAKAASEDRIEGFETGADDYLIKPFEPRELVTRVRNLIGIRRKLRERFSIGVVLKPGEISSRSVDDVFLVKVMAAVEKEIGNENFTVEELGREVGMSRSQLHRKLVALTNQAPNEFIRSMRLQRAMDLLKKDSGTVSEIAYGVGFSDPSYFSKLFHHQFGVRPSEVRKAAVGK
jgi:signal transduction histidine kinase/DNA-binding response OmpR family regulator/ligand-binding sensor domain-containing protein